MIIINTFYIICVLSNFYKHDDSWFMWRTELDWENRLFPCDIIHDYPETFVYIKDGHFYMNNHRIRFFGTTIGWEFLSCDNMTMERSVKYMKNLGINAVRIHPLGLWEENESRLNPKILERLDFLVFLLRKYNIFYTFYSGVTIVVHQISEEEMIIKKVIPFFNKSIEMKIKKFYKLLFLHKNKYTNIKYINDKYMAFIILSNENSPYKLLNYQKGKEILYKFYKKLSSDSIELNNVKVNNIDEFHSFLNKKESNFYKSMKSYLREIGIKVPIALTNNPFSFFTQRLQYEYGDFIAVHTYGNYAGGTNRKLVKNKNPLIWENNIPEDFPTRALTVNYQYKPIIIDEWNIGYPVDYRVVGPFLITILSSLYDYDGIFYFNFFAHSKHLESPYQKGYYYWSSLEQPFSPINTGVFPMLSKIFRYFEIEPFKNSITININEKNSHVDGEFQYRYNPLTGYYSKIHYLFRVILEFNKTLSNLNYIKETYKELVFNNEFIDTDNYFWDYRNGAFYYKSSSLLFFCGDPQYIEKQFKISSDNDFFALSIYSLDKKDIYYSDSLFVFIGSDAEYFGDFLLSLQKYIDKYNVAYYVPSKNDYLSAERIPAVSYLEPSNTSFEIHKKEGKYSLYSLDEKFDYMDIVEKCIDVKNNNLLININQKDTKSIFYLIVRN